MDRILISSKKENGPRASSAPALGLHTIIFKHVYWYMQQTQVSVYRTIGPLVGFMTPVGAIWSLLTFKDEEAEVVPLFIGFMTPVGAIWSLLTFKDEEAEVVPLFIGFRTPVGAIWSLLTFKDEEAEVVTLFIGV